MIKLNVVKILDYYDYPQIFLSKDIFDSNFICVIGDVQDNYLYYIGVKITVQELKDLYKNTIDISALFTNEPAKSFINFKLNQDSDEDISANETTLAEISDFIPDEGLYIEDIADNCYLSDLAIDKNKTIFENKNELNDFQKTAFSVFDFNLFYNTNIYTNKKELLTKEEIYEDALNIASSQRELLFCGIYYLKHKFKYIKNSKHDKIIKILLENKKFKGFPTKKDILIKQEND